MINPVDPFLASTFLTPFDTKQQLKDWIHVFLGLDLPDSYIDPGSNSSPIDWMFETYQNYRYNRGNKVPSVIVVSSRESYKTISESIWGIIGMVHFKATLAHMAAIVPQATAAQKYIQAFLRDIGPYLDYHKMDMHSSNAKEISIKHSTGEVAYMKIIVCSLAGANSSHTNLMCVSGKTPILVENYKPHIKRDRIRIQASKLHKLCESGQDIKIIAYNHQTGTLEPKRMLKSFDNGRKGMVDIRLSDGKIVTTTPDHKFLSESGQYLPIESLFGKTVYTTHKVKLYAERKTFKPCLSLPDIKYQEPPLKEFDQFVLGGLLGDMCIFRRRNYRKKAIGTYVHSERIGTPMVTFNHGEPQREYAEWKRDILQKYIPVKSGHAISGYTGKKLVSFYTGHNEIFMPYDAFRDHFNGVERLEALGLAIWFMDDGSYSSGGFTISTHSFRHDQQLLLQKLLFEKFDISVVIGHERKKDGRVFEYLKGGSLDSYKLYQIIKKYLHPIFDYKFRQMLDHSIHVCKNCGDQFLAVMISPNSLYCGNAICQSIRDKVLRKVTVVSITPATYNRHVYDFTVEDHHNYFANNILVHNCVDEIDTIRSAEGVRAFQEGNLIPGVFNGQFPITVKTSTMKFPGGLFAKEMDLAKKKGWPIYKWNILDITEWCPPDRCLPDQPTESVYICRNLPLQTIAIDEYSKLLAKEQEDYEFIDQMKGCVACSLGPICKGRLHRRNQSDKGGLWKPIDFTIIQFDKTDPDMAEAQLLCKKPSSAGMVYPRFIDKADGTGNTYTLEQAWENYTGVIPIKKIAHEQLIQEMLKNGVKFYCGVDWGYTHAFAIIVGAIMPNKEFWIVDAYSIPGLEFAQMMDLAMSVRDKYRPHSWFCDTSAPMFIKEFKKNKMACPKFTKDVLGGISAIRTQIVNGKGHRSLKVIKSVKTEILLKIFAEHCFKLDTIGNVTQEPDDSETVADPADALRYMGQNLFKPKSKNYVAQDHEPSQTPFTELNNAYMNNRPDPSSFIVDSDLLTDFGA